MARKLYQQKKDATDAYFEKHFSRPQPPQYSEQNLVLYPAAYNRLGLLGDFEVYVLQNQKLHSMSGRTGPYTSVKEWFQGVGKDLIGHEPEYVTAILKPGVQSGRMSGASGSIPLVYRVGKEDAQKLEEIAKDIQPLKNTVMVL